MDDEASKNFILNSLTITEYEWLRSKLKQVELQQSNITILNREGMEDAACECYQILQKALDRYLYS